jgi:hypothetical protein
VLRPPLALLGGLPDSPVAAAIGTYGVLSYMVAERRREIGIRVALGADQGSVLGQVMKQGLTLTTIGIVAPPGARAEQIDRDAVVRRAADAVTIIAVVAITLVAAVACAPRVAGFAVDPNVVLRRLAVYV